MSKRKRDYLFKRPNSQHWRVRFQMGGRSVEKSLGTPDRAHAEIIALPLIAEHKAKLLEARPRVERSWQPQYEPGREHVGPDGSRIIATERELFHLDATGRIIGKTDNGLVAFQLAAGGKLIARSLTEAYLEDSEASGITRFLRQLHGKRPTLPTKSGDDAILETYLKHAGITGYFEREARSVWALYKTLVGNTQLKDATRDDGRKLVAQFEGKGLKSATIGKKIGWLNAMVNLAIKEGRLKFNPFASVVPKRDDKQRRLPLSDADVRECKRNLDKLSESDQLLIRLLGSTGMRLSEAMEIEGEEKEKGCRYVVVGKKTEQSLRRVPLPTAVLPFVPKTIKGPLFAGDTAAASKRLNRFLNDCGIADPRKVVHSLRHRAQDRLRAAGCPEDVRWAILGHEEETVAAGYGEGFPVPLLRKWVDKIGF
jgi:integrase